MRSGTTTQRSLRQLFGLDDRCFRCHQHKHTPQHIRELSRLLNKLCEPTVTSRSARHHLFAVATCVLCDSCQFEFGVIENVAERLRRHFLGSRQQHLVGHL